MIRIWLCLKLLLRNPFYFVTATLQPALVLLAIRQPDDRLRLGALLAGALSAALFSAGTTLKRLRMMGVLEIHAALSSPSRILLPFALASTAHATLMAPVAPVIARLTGTDVALPTVPILLVGVATSIFACTATGLVLAVLLFPVRESATLFNLSEYPLVLLSGIGVAGEALARQGGSLLPTRWAVDSLTRAQTVSDSLTLASISCVLSITALIAAQWLTPKVLRRATARGELALD